MMRVSRAVVDVLLALRPGASFGWEIMQITGRPGGTVYPILKRLTEAGYIEWHWETGGHAKRCYTLTDLGQAEAKRWAKVQNNVEEPDSGTGAR